MNKIAAFSIVGCITPFTLACAIGSNTEDIRIACCCPGSPECPKLQASSSVLGFSVVFREINGVSIITIEEAAFS
jgi:hypothetical protein